MQRRLISTWVFATFVSLCGGGIATSLRAQTAEGQVAAAAAERATPQWEVDAGRKKAFDSVSVAAATPSTAEESNMPLGPGDVFSPTKGTFSAKSVLLVEYVVFAYKLIATPAQVQAIRTQLPAWANANRYDIEGHAPVNTTKDQFRLMLQALLADRFKLQLHWETLTQPIYALVLDTPGKRGPKLRPHGSTPPCPTKPPPAGRSAFAGDFPFSCGGVVSEPEPRALREHIGGRRVTMAQIAGSLGGNPSADLNRPVVDQSGLNGNFDFSLDFTPGLNDMPPGFEHLESELPLGDALKQQLGLKLVPQTGPVEFLFIDHVERPSPN